MQRQIILEFNSLEVTAKLFESSTADKFLQNLPYEIKLSHWGKEYYGPIGIDIEEENPISEIPSGGIAYSRKGNYFCIFLGQNPAWPVEHIGQIPEKEEKKLEEAEELRSVKIKSKE